MLNVAVCDDEREIVDRICGYLDEYDAAKSTKSQVQTFLCGEDLSHCDANFDLILLDIEMGGIDGFQTAKRIRKRDKNVSLIYITSHFEYALKVFAVHPFDFVVKPIDKDKLFVILNSFYEYHSEKAKSRTLTFKRANAEIYLDANDIFFFEYTDNRIVTAVTKQGKIELKSSVSEILSATKLHGFASPHKGFVVNLAYVKDVETGDVRMSNGVLIPVAHRRRKDFKDELLNYYHDSLL
jgi:two-component system LytT family response regulator